MRNGTNICKLLLATMILAVGPGLAQAGAKDKSKPLMRDFLGLNAHFTVKPELYKPVCRLLRNYHSIQFGDTDGREWSAHPELASAYAGAYAGYFGPTGRAKLLEAAEIGNEPTGIKDADYRMSRSGRT